MTTDSRIAALAGAHICSGWCDHPELPTAIVTLAYLHGQEAEIARLRRMLAEASSLIGELAEVVHQIDSLRSHADPNDKTGWNRHGIETCADALCVDALALRAELEEDR